jgi:hypothetical protein
MIEELESDVSVTEMRIKKLKEFVQKQKARRPETSELLVSMESPRTVRNAELRKGLSKKAVAAKSRSLPEIGLMQVTASSKINLFKTGDKQPRNV